MFKRIVNGLKRINSVSTPIGGIGWDASPRESEHPAGGESSLPRTYPPTLVREIVKRAYDEETGFISVKYGSAARDGAGGDEDYLVLVFSKATEADPITLLLSHADKPWHDHETAIDVTMREFHSFVFGLVLGRPFEHSVAEDGVIVDSEVVPRSYWSWVQALKDNIQIDPQSLRDHLIDTDLKAAFSLFKDGQSNRDIHKVVVGAYSATSLLLQSSLLRDRKAPLYSDDVYPLSQARYLLEKIEDRETQARYQLIVSAAKRSVAPSSPPEFIKTCEEAIDSMRRMNE